MNSEEWTIEDRPDRTPLVAGAQIGSYRIDSPLGEGGMGTVYRATDTKLNRPVAIKFLSDELADPAARRRFQREAQMASSLNHPHILTVYDVGEHEGRQYLVTEFVDGGTLRDWNKTEKRTWQQIVELLIGVADGLAAAHAAGILHRDIKPPNILVAKNGYAKLADFGLAKLVEKSESDATQTMTEGQTRPGVILGTIAYMSPEQAAGRPVDPRSDVFSFGIVLYELLAGQRPFTGVSDLEVLQAIIHRESASLPGDLPASLRLAVEKALEKDPAERYQTMRDLVVDLRRAVKQKPDQPGQPAVAPPRRKMALAIGIVVALLAAVAAGTYWRLVQSDYFWKNPLDGSRARFQKLTDWPGTELDASISQDGKFVAFLADREGIYDTWITQVGSGEFRNLTQGKYQTLLHEMTRTTGFNADGTQVWIRTTPPSNAAAVASLAQVPTMGGSARPFLSPQSLNPVWSTDGSGLLFHHSTPGDPITLAEPDGRKETKIFVGRTGEHNHYVTWSPDKKFVYFVRNWRSTEADIWRVPSGGGMPEQITHHNSHVAYPIFIDNRTLLYRATAADGAGWVLYGMDVEHRIAHQVSVGVEEYQSVAGSADGRRLVATVSNPVVSLWKAPITAGTVAESAASRVSVPAAHAKSGRYGPGYLLFLSGKGGEGGLLRWKDGAAVELWKSNGERLAGAAAIAADGSDIAFSVRQDSRNTLYVASADGTSARPLAEQLDLRGAPSWSPDGKWIAVSADTGEGSRIYKVPVEGGEPVRLTDKLSFSPVWSPAGDLIIYDDGAVGGANFPLLGIRPDRTAVKLPEVRYRGDYEGYHFMPDGKNIVVIQGEFRAQDFWMLDLKTGDRRRLTDLKPGYSVRSFDISPDGREILFDRIQENSDIVLIDLPK